MSDPYGRDKIPDPPKKPNHFSVFRPFVVFFGFNFRMFKRFLWLLLFIPRCFGRLGVWAYEEGHENDFGPFVAAFFGYLLMEALVLLTVIGVMLVIGFSSVWLNQWPVWVGVGVAHVLIYLAYYSFKLDNKKSWLHWSEKLLHNKPVD